MKILISNYFGLGNFIQTIPLIENLKKVHDITLLDKDNKFDIHNLLNVNFIKFSKITKKKINIFNLVIFPGRSSPDWHVIFFLFFSFKNKIIITSSSFGKKKQKIIILLLIYIRKYLLFRNTKYLKNIDVHNIKINDLIINEILNKKVLTKKYETFIQNNFNSSIDCNKWTPYICIQLFCGIGINSPKNWEIDKFFEVIKLLSNHKYKILLIGDNDFNSLIKNEFQNNNQFKNVVNLLGKTNIVDLINVLHYSSFILCLESGVMHIADFINHKNTLALCGPSNMNMIRPLSKNIKIVNFYHNNLPIFNNNLDEFDFLNKSNNLKQYKIDIKPKDIYKKILNLINDKKN